MLTVQGLAKAIQLMSRETGNRRRYNMLRYDAGVTFMDHCAAQSSFFSDQLTASFRRHSFKGNKEWILELKGTNAIEAGTKVPQARKLGASKYMSRALSRTRIMLPDMARNFYRVTGKAAGFDVSR
jgi:hypothetical protein